MPQRLRELPQFDFSGGLNAVTNPNDLTPKQVFRVRNLNLDEHGSLRTRDGYSVVTTAPTDTTNPIVYRDILNLSVGTPYAYAIQASASSASLYRTDTNPWTFITSWSQSSFFTPQSVTISDQAFIVDGYGVTPKLYNGLSASDLTVQAGQTPPPGAKHVALHLGAVWLWNTAASNTTLDGPSSLRSSGYAGTPSGTGTGAINDWPSSNQTFISKDDGQVGMGLASFTIVETGISPTTTLIAFKNYSAYQVTGVFGGTAFSVQKIKSDMGCVAPRTIQFASGFGIIRLAHKGFALFNGVDDRLISEEVRPYIFGRDDITGLNFNAIDRAWAVQSQNPPLYIAACPVVGTPLSRFFVYDLVRRAWSILDFPVNVQCLALTVTPTTIPVVHAGRDTSGQIIQLFNGDLTDAGAAIQWSVQTRNFFTGSPLRPSYWRRMILDLLFTPTQSTTVTTILGGMSKSVVKSATYTGSVTLPQYGSAIYGQSQYGTPLVGTIDARQSVDILQTAATANATITGTGPVRIRGLAFHASGKPLKAMAF